MNTKATAPPVPAAEVARRLAEYRRLGLERKAPAQVVYQEPHVWCPWPDCGYRIDGIHFQLEQWNDANELSRLLDAWWRGSGLVGRCPGCNRHVLFALTTKVIVTDPSLAPDGLLPDDWHSKAHLVIKSCL